MNVFIDLCIMFVPSIIVWHLFFEFVYSTGRYQKYRFRKALEKLLLSPYDTIDIIHKNKKFAVHIEFKRINAHYGYYEIYINEKLAATYHQLSHACLNSYYFSEENKRHQSEVDSIVYATCKVLKDKEKPKKVKHNGWDEYSYFK